jgi:hypothetical protein
MVSMDDLSHDAWVLRLRPGTIYQPADLTGRPGEMVIRSPEGRYFLMGPAEAALLGLMDGTYTLESLSAAAGRLPGGPHPEGVVAAFVAALARAGLLEGGGEAGRGGYLTPRRVRLFDPTPILKPVCRVLRHAPVHLGLCAYLGLVAAGVWAAAQVGVGLGHLWREAAIVERLPVILLVAWWLGLTHELAHGAGAILTGGRVRSIGLAFERWRLVFFAEVVDLVMLPRRSRIWTIAAGPMMDAAVAATSLILWHLFPRALPASGLVAAAAVARVGWNLVPLLRTDGYRLLVEVLRRPGLEWSGRAALRRWLRSAGRRGARGGAVYLDPFLVAYGACSVAAEGLVILVLLAVMAKGIARAWGL